MKHETITLLFLLVVTIPVSIIDIRKQKIPDILTYPAIGIFIMIRIWIFQNSLFAVFLLPVAGFIPFFLIWFFTKGKMGLGDAKLSAFLALILGMEQWFIMVFLSSLFALILAVILLTAKNIRRSTKIPYGPFLSLGALVAFFINI